MEVNTTGKHVESDAAASEIIDFLQSDEAALGLSAARLYYDFPLYKDLDEPLVTSKILIVCPTHGVLTIGTSNVAHQESIEKDLIEANERLDAVFTSLFSRLIRNPGLRKSKTELRFPVNALLYAPFVGSIPPDIDLETPIVCTKKSLADYLTSIERTPPIPDNTLIELISTIEGSKAIARHKPRDIQGSDPNSKGNLVNRLESEIARFDSRQLQGNISVLDGLQRIRGLAGSGKTVVLAMKAALTHLRDPDANILYTFYTRSLYQHIQRLITRFYRQFNDSDPDWNRLHILHAWGGYSVSGVYFQACLQHGVEPVRYSDAARRNPQNPFDYVCRNLLDSAKISPMFDYVFVDEGQDFPNSFLSLCTSLANRSRLVYAYDELQTIFQVKAPEPSEFAGPNIDLSDDIVLYKCYRNPREILVCAHALGFGIYGSRIVQMLENKEHWEDVGYKVWEGQFVEGAKIVIERPAENSLSIISNAQSPNEIVKATAHADYDAEIGAIVEGIRHDIEEGLRPDDILVVVIDDRNARIYLSSIAAGLASHGINSNNVHVDDYGLRDFHKDGCVTLSTVHKAKGNEAFMVYVVGVDALFSSYAGVRDRNILFTAITRAKGWVRLSGIGEGASKCVEETQRALENFPYLRFTYPSSEQLKIMRRDLAEKAIRKQKTERMLEKALEEMSPEEIKRFIDQRSIRKGAR